ncbi:MAG: hypothetical protein KGJ80_02060 [Chloroflexota bacterium]|nr:hypothetical protein [Chloroflexota bacterium]
MVKHGRTIYVCRVCHRVGPRPLTCHPRASVKCDAGTPGDERSMPLYDAHGHLATRAPKWWVEACFKSKVKSSK